MLTLQSAGGLVVGRCSCCHREPGPDAVLQQKVRQFGGGHALKRQTTMPTSSAKIVYQGEKTAISCFSVKTNWWKTPLTVSAVLLCCFQNKNRTISSTPKVRTAWAQWKTKQEELTQVVKL